MLLARKGYICKPFSSRVGPGFGSKRLTIVHLMKFTCLRHIFLFLFATLWAVTARGQINAEQVLRVGQNALYFEDYMLSIQYFNQAIMAKPYLAQPYFMRAIAKLNLEDYLGAEEDATAAIERNPFIADAYEVRGGAPEPWQVAGCGR